MTIKQNLQIKENNIVSKSNTLIEANSRLNLVEQKLILCLASNIEPNDRDFKTYTFAIKQFHELLGLSGSTKYTELSRITKDLLSKVIEIRIDEELIQVSWLSSAIYNRNKGTIDMRFDPLLKPFLLELSNKFTSYRLANIVKLKSIYAIRIYELLKQYEDLKERTISLENLRYYLDVMDVYPQYANFKQRVLSTSQKELKQKTDISFEFEEIKSGRKVQKIRFIICSQKNKDPDLDGFEKKLDQFQQPNLFEQKIKRFEERWKQKVYPKLFEKWKEHKEIVLEIIEDIHFRSDIDSPIGYVESRLNFKLEEMVKLTTTGSNTQHLLEIKSIITAVIDKYSSSTGTVATFLIKDWAVGELIKLVTMDEAERIWGENESLIMDKIYEKIKKNRRNRRY
ncbi:replication initiation protein [Bacillus toyonensis]|uniref:replication initiation protein n=1 Tax=Bacillus toyonensis TaxID=155322 RepID=UPI000BFC16CC|nr:replication initiation protein [Bacillus toyonensis]PHG59739.1 initiator RepB protein [Bacillus toyonensis]